MSLTDSQLKAPMFTFVELKSRLYNSLTSKDATAMLMKWSMKGRLHALTFSFDQNFREYDSECFLKSFINDPSVQNSMVHNGVFTAGTVDGKNCTCEVSRVPCTLTSMNIFHSVKSAVARPNGAIVKCYDELIDSIFISDELGKFILDKDFEKYTAISPKEREEFLFRIFSHIYIGGELCQREENINVYVDFTRNIYRDLVSVQKTTDSKEIRVVSLVYKFQFSDENGPIFPSQEEHVNTFAYAVVDPYKRNVILFCHMFGCGDF